MNNCPGGDSFHPMSDSADRSVHVSRTITETARRAPRFRRTPRYHL